MHFSWESREVTSNNPSKTNCISFLVYTKAEELKESIAEGPNDCQLGYLDELIDIIYSCGYTDGYDDAKFFYEKIR